MTAARSATVYQLLSTDYFLNNESLNRVGDAALVVGGGGVEARGRVEAGVGVAHQDACARPLQHLKVVEVVADGQHLFAREPLLGGHGRQARALRSLRVQNVQQREVHLRVEREQ